MSSAVDDQQEEYLQGEERNRCSSGREWHLENATQLLQSKPSAGQSEFTKVLLFSE